MPAPTDQRLRFFADVPDFTGYAFPEAPPDDGQDVEESPPTSRVQVAKAGKFKHPRYGTFTITPETFDRMIANFQAGVPTDELPVDFDHEPDYGGSSEACGWIKGLEQDGKALYASVEWRWPGAFAIRDKAYRYVSPTWSLAHVGEDGTKHGPTLLAFALTNRPYFSMPSVSLSASFSRDAALPLCEEVETDAPDVSDSRPRMAELANIAKVFGLDAEATEEDILKVAARLSTEAGERREAASILSRVARELGVDDAEEDKLLASITALKPDSDYVTVSSAKLDELTTLAREANEGRAAQTELAEMRFTVAFEKAMGEGRAAPATKEGLKELFDKQPDQTLKLLENLPPLVNVNALGATGDQGDAPDGVDPQSYQLNRRAKTYAREHKVDYLAALEAVTEEAGV